ncbi:MAG: PIN domain nuclease [Proteobacteria bacterium]|nr:PIN domain nuclease [Pseudomonadota bacterium]
MYLIDTSIWIDYLREENNPCIQYFTNILDQKLPFGITGIIYQEVLQGAASEKDFNQLVNYLNTQRFYHLRDPIVSYQAAAQLYFECRKKGITIRSTIDCLVAQVAIEHDLILLHNDKDYIQLKKVIPKLKLIN